MNFAEDYSKKLKSPRDAVKVIKSGDWVDYGCLTGEPIALDKALAQRKEELREVKIRSLNRMAHVEVVKADPEGESFTYHSWFLSGGERKLHDKGQCYFIPMLYREMPKIYRQEVEVDVAMIQVAPMDKHGFFNFGLHSAFHRAILDKAKYIIVEVNKNIPRAHGGNEEVIHISEVDCVVEGENPPLPVLPEMSISAIDQKIAEMIVGEIEDGACLQLGIGGMPNAVGKLIAQSDLKDLGVQSEMFCDAFMDMYKAGKITGLRKNNNKSKMVFNFALGSQELYDFIDDNPLLASFPVDYTNDPHIIAQNDKVCSINNCVEVDIYGQICSESSGFRQISGTGGQLDYFEGAFMSNGGKAFCCLSSTFTNKAGELVSRIRPVLTTGAIVSTPRTVVNYLVTEYGMVNLKGLSTWERAEAIVSIAHPDFREELIKQAETYGIWRPSNKR